jgi:outer membrane protein OmpA-like peptidoglycan-associated protein
LPLILRLSEGTSTLELWSSPPADVARHPFVPRNVDDAVSRLRDANPRDVRDAADQLGGRTEHDEEGALLVLARAWVDGRLSLHTTPRRIGRTDPIESQITDLADLAGPTESTEQESKTSWFEVRLVDEIGEPISGIPLVVFVDGERQNHDTDGDGKVRIDDAELGTAYVDFADPSKLYDDLKERWAEIRDGEWVSEALPDHTFFRASKLPKGVRLQWETPHTLVVQPRVVLGRLGGLLFDTSKSFLLPSALPPLQRLKRLYDSNPDSALLIVGHTDTTGDTDYNDPLSLERAKTTQAFLLDDPAPWLDWYEDSHPVAKRWGAREDGLMLDAVLARGEEPPPPGSKLRHFQSTRGLEVDGIAGPQTREALIKEYMAVDDTTLPAGVEITVHGCGENFPLGADGQTVDSDAPDGHEDAVDRRVELFFFDAKLGVLPPPPGDNSPPDSKEYPEWRKRAVETHEFITPGEYTKLVIDDPLFGPAAGIDVEVTYELSDPETIKTDGGGAFVLRASWGRYADLKYTWQGREIQRRVFTALDDGASKDGAWQRLVHLGYYWSDEPPEPSPPDDDVFGDALVMFQVDYGLEPTGELDDASADELICAHDEDQRAWQDRDWELHDEPEPDSPKPKEMVA